MEPAAGSFFYDLCDLPDRLDNPQLTVHSRDRYQDRILPQLFLQQFRIDLPILSDIHQIALIPLFPKPVQRAADRRMLQCCGYNMLSCAALCPGDPLNGKIVSLTCPGSINNLRWLYMQKGSDRLCCFCQFLPGSPACRVRCIGIARKFVFCMDKSIQHSRIGRCIR